MKAFIPNAKVRMELERKIMLYVQQDTGKVPPVFQPTFKAIGFRFINPINLLRNAVIVRAFGKLWYSNSEAEYSPYVGHVSD